MEAIQIYPHILLSDFLRYFIAASTAYILFWVIFKKQWHHRIIQKKEPQAKKMWDEFLYSMSTVFIFSLTGLFIATSKIAGYTQIYDEIEAYGWLWFFGSIFVLMLIHDAYFYWVHRWMHHPKVYRHVHAVHHRSTNPSPWAAYSFHPIEALVESAFFVLIVFILPAHVLALFLFLVHMIARNVLGHLGIELYPKWFVRSKWLNWMTTTTHHDMHHKHFNSNYGLYFTWWDKWFSTEDQRYIETFEEVASRSKTSMVKPENTVSHKSSKNFKTVTKSKWISIILLTCSSCLLFAQSPVGTWQSFDENTKRPVATIEVNLVGNRLEGNIQKIHLQPYQDTHPICTECKGNLKNQPVIGMNFLWGFDSKGHNGKILDPANGEVYQCKMWLENEKTLKVRGYAGPMNLFYRTQVWQLEESKGAVNSFVGVWKTIDDETKKARSLVEIFEENGEYKGRILKLFLQPWEGENPVCWGCSGERNNVPLLGMKLLWNYTQKDKKTWTNGKVFDPMNDKTYNSMIWMEDENTLKIRGYWGIFFRTQTWKRLEEVGLP